MRFAQKHCLFFNTINVYMCLFFLHFSTFYLLFPHIYVILILDYIYFSIFHYQKEDFI